MRAWMAPIVIAVLVLLGFLFLRDVEQREAVIFHVTVPGGGRRVVKFLLPEGVRPHQVDTLALRDTIEARLARSPANVLLGAP